MSNDAHPDPAVKLVTMANQIGHFFAHKGAAAPPLIAAHIIDFWTPRMREQLRAHVAAGGAGLEPLPRQAADMV
jgi:formate dehydrogenase subunit delta